jgi:hypothetical protein
MAVIPDQMRNYPGQLEYAIDPSSVVKLLTQLSRDYGSDPSSAAKLLTQLSLGMAVIPAQLLNSSPSSDWVWQ